MALVSTIPGHILGSGEKLTRAIINLIARPTVDLGQVNFLPNLILNPQFEVCQRADAEALPFRGSHEFENDDDVYLFDQWNLLSDGDDAADLNKKVLTSPVNGSLNAIEFEVETPSKRFGIVQFLESIKTYPLRGQKVTLSFSAAGALDNVRAAVIEWDGTADSITSDVVSDWQSAGTSPSLVNNWAYCVDGNGGDNLLSTTHQTFSIEGVAVSESANNLGIFLYIDDDDGTAGETLELTTVQLILNDTEAAYRPYDRMADQLACERFFTLQHAARVNGYLTSSGREVSSYISFPYKRIDPTITRHNESRTNASQSSVGTESISRHGCLFRGDSSGSGEVIITADLAITAEL